MIENSAKNAIKAILAVNLSDIVSGLTSNGSPVASPDITTSTGTPPRDSRPFISINSSGRDITFNVSPLTIKSSDLRITIFVRDNIVAEVDEDQLYERGSDNHSDIGDRIVKILLREFSTNRFILDPDTGFRFYLHAEGGMRKTNRAAAWDTPEYYVVSLSEITFNIRTSCEEQTF